ncbi:hypothetical protein [Nocardia carnea]|uniref:hypothetical protein n=1 Tax=Nocardia carnea TaxID=37328 RepID=UPI002457C365|nr:hypothetical protein [Nocardia carnea]
MVRNVAQDPDAWRRTGNGERAAGDVDHQRAVGDPEWEGSLEYQHGKAANAFNTWAREHARGREAAFTRGGNLRHGMGDSSTSGGNTFETTDLDGGVRVRGASADSDV